MSGRFPGYQNGHQGQHHHRGLHHGPHQHQHFQHHSQPHPRHHFAPIHRHRHNLQHHNPNQQVAAAAAAAAATAAARATGGTATAAASINSFGSLSTNYHSDLFSCTPETYAAYYAQQAAVAAAAAAAATSNQHATNAALVPSAFAQDATSTAAVTAVNTAQVCAQLLAMATNSGGTQAAHAAYSVQPVMYPVAIPQQQIEPAIPLPSIPLPPLPPTNPQLSPQMHPSPVLRIPEPPVPDVDAQENQHRESIMEKNQIITNGATTCFLEDPGTAVFMLADEGSACFITSAGYQPQPAQQKPRKPMQIVCGGINLPNSDLPVTRLQSEELLKKLNVGPTSNPSPLMRFCDVCKVSTIGDISFREHLKGQKHVKKFTALKKLAELSGTNSTAANVETMNGSDLESQTVTSSSMNEAEIINQNNVPPISNSNNNNSKAISSTNLSLRCLLCDVSCVSVDAYRGHINGMKHIRTARLQSSLGRELPSLVPDISSPNGTVPDVIKLKVISEFEALDLKARKGPAEAAKMLANRPTATEYDEDFDEEMFESKPVGVDFIEEVINEAGKTVCYTCTLCECRFNDPNAKMMHLKGKKHRIRYKKRVDPAFMVNVIKADIRKIERQKVRKTSTLENPEVKRFSVDTEYFIMFANRHFNGFGFNTHANDPEPQMANNQRVEIANFINMQKTTIDALVEYKHSQIIAPVPIVRKIHEMVGILERASRTIVAYANKTWMNIQSEDYLLVKAIKSEQIDLTNLQHLDLELAQTEVQLPDKIDMGDELLCLLRVGALGKGYLLHDDTEVEVVILCNFFPTHQLLDIFVVYLVSLMNKSTQKYFFQMEKGEIGFRLTVNEIAVAKSTQSDEADAESQVAVGETSQLLCIIINVSFTSNLIRPTLGDDENAIKGLTKLLNRSLCLEALSEVRRLHFFRIKHTFYKYFQLTIRVLRSILKIKPWKNIPIYVIELTVDRILTSTGLIPVSSLIRHFFEFFSFGFVMPFGTGLGDPCERAFPDVFSFLTLQEREDLIASAQHILRLIAMRQMHKVLDLNLEEMQEKSIVSKNRPKKNRKLPKTESVIVQTSSSQDLSVGMQHTSNSPSKKSKRGGCTQGVRKEKKPRRGHRPEDFELGHVHMVNPFPYGGSIRETMGPPRMPPPKRGPPGPYYQQTSGKRGRMGFARSFNGIDPMEQYGSYNTHNQMGPRPHF